MKYLVFLAATLALASAQDVDTACANPSSTECEAFALDWIDNTYEPEFRAMLEESTDADWVYNTNINQETQDAQAAAFSKQAAYTSQVWNDYITKFGIDDFQDETLKRRLNRMRVLGNAALSEEKYAELTDTINGMTNIFNQARVCPFEKQDCDLATEGLALEPDLEAILADTDPSINSYEKIQYVWDQFREASGKNMRELFKTYIGLNNEAAVANGLADASELWLQPYTDDLEADEDFRQDLEDLWQTLRPLYVKLHAYIRYKYLEAWNETPGVDKFDPTGPIPAHLSGNMWAQQWQNTFNLVAPFPEAENPLSGIDQALIDQGYDQVQIFELSNDFYNSLGLADMTMCYTTDCAQEDTAENRECHASQPMIYKPDWDVTCHASAWDMYHEDKSDYRIKMCTDVDLNDLVTIHHEMGHIQYFIQYVDEPLQFRDGANPGFHEAIGDTMALAVQTPSHLNKIGLLDTVPNSYESDINFLMQQAMERVMFPPFAYTIDQYRWSLFDGTTSTDNMNAKWWELREKYQGIAAPSERDETDFDAGAKYHVAASVPYIRYFVAHVLEYEFYQAMCLEADQYNPLDPLKPLYKCDFSQGLVENAGRLLETLLEAGASKPWPETLESVTGSRKMDASAMLEYFAPLDDWLSEYIVLNNLPVGW